MEEFRLKCDFCKRIIESSNPKHLPCSACSHGTLKRSIRKNHCDICSAPIYDNVRSDRRATCGDCTLKKVLEVNRVEQMAGVRITGKGSAKAYEEINKIAETKKDRKSLAGLLAPIRKSKGFSQGSLAEELGVSQNYLSEMEHGRKPLSIKALQWIRENSQGEAR